MPERDLVHVGVEPGRFVATFSALPGREFESSVKEFVSEADPVTQTFEIALIFPAPGDVNILPGMTATITWYPPPEVMRSLGVDTTRLTVPSTAIFEDTVTGQVSVWIVDQGTMKVSRRTVEIGRIVADDMVEVTGGLEPGEMIATAGVHHLREGMRVKRLRGRTIPQRAGSGEAAG